MTAPSRGEDTANVGQLDEQVASELPGAPALM